jgi:short-subunit dehydrogenase
VSSPIDGGTVLITGASSGIGLAIAEQCASRAKALVLVARRKDRLDKLADSLREQHPKLDVHTFACDLSKRDATEAFIASVGEQGLEIDVLVNNAGLGDMGMFEKSKLEKQLFLVDVNVSALILLTHAFLPGMVARGRGSVLMVSSGFGLSYLPGFATYIGTKHFVTGFTESLHCELAGSGVHVGQLCPGPVATEFEQVMGNNTGMKVPGFAELSAKACAAEGIRVIDSRRALIVPHVLFHVILWLAARTPRWLTRFWMRLLGRRVRSTQLAKHTAT